MFYHFIRFYPQCIRENIRSKKKDNTLRGEGTIVNKRNFGILECSGPRREREMKISIYDVAGKEIWSRTIKSE